MSRLQMLELVEATAELERVRTELADQERTSSILGDAAVELGAELERVRAELADVREILELVEQERDEYRGAITAHRAAIYAPHRTGNDADRSLWEAIR